ncbi:PREDICTED: tRNA-splicing endonuclease subunit Sen2 [Papilio xuthus]|uniref:tRNA-splicing endonuclease subunit Sen2 n=1 Tax=Papilio xuthus TaxID=66420 RepID=A0AAJ7EJT4_PAPXU
MEVEPSLRFPLDGSMQIIFTGYYNGFGVEVRSVDEMNLLYNMGCFGKGTSSRSKPRESQNVPAVMRKRQFLKRMCWCKKYGDSKKSLKSDTFLKDVNKLAAKILSDGEKQLKKDVIDLVSSEESGEEDDNCDMFSLENYNKEDLVVIIPNSDSEDDDYFANLKPKCCVNKIKIQEKLMLSKQESFFLLYGLGCLQILNNYDNVLNIEQCWKLFQEDDKYFLEKYVVYHYFRSKGYVVKPGIKFGGDFLLYKEGPSVNHADFIVLIKYAGEEYDWISIFGHLRVASTTVKEILIVEVIQPNKEELQLPKDLKEYSVREVLLSRNNPVAINDEIE